MAYEESPWLQESKGHAGSDDEHDRNLARVLDPRVATAQREQALAKLRKAQLGSGAFPWWPGGPPSSYMTLYLTYGFSKAAEFGVDVPKDMVQSRLPLPRRRLPRGVGGRGSPTPSIGSS